MEEKILYRISNDSAYDTQDKFIRLSKTNIDFLNWLGENGFLDEDVSYNIVDELPKVIEF
jgi:hypothetical protein